MLSEELEKIVKRQRKIIPFLKKLSPADKRELVPFLKKFHKKVFEFNFVEKQSLFGGVSYTSNYKYSDKQREIVQKACFVCFNKTDAKRVLFNLSNLCVSDDYLENIIPWYTPKWFSDVINEDTPWSLEYMKAIMLNKKGLLELSDTLIRAILPRAIITHKWDNKTNRQLNFYKPEELLKHPVTLEKHIWLLFEDESTINNYYDYNNVQNYNNRNNIWNDTIVDFVHTGKIDRRKTLVATIDTATKGFNKNLSGWFFDVLIKLDPSPEEVINLQEEFFSALNSPHSKVINTVLKYFKKVVNNKKFKSELFIDNCSILLNSETKTVVNSVLMILDKITKTHPKLADVICLKASEALMNSDEKIQLRAAKIIAKYGNEKDEGLINEISMYSDSLLYSSKEVLQEYLNTSEEFFEDEESTDTQSIIQDSNQLPIYTSFDDLIFFISQAIDNNNVYDIDLAMNYLPKLNVLINEENVEKLESIFKRSKDVSLSLQRRASIGQLEVLLTYLINDFFNIIEDRFPSKFQSLKKTTSKKIADLLENSYYKSHFKNIVKPIEEQAIPDYIYKLHHALVLKSKELIKKNKTLDLLSTPTHEPCWIAPKIFIDRIVAYEQSNEQIELYDFQIAIGRIPKEEYVADELEMLKEAIHKIKDVELKKAVLYHFGYIKIQDEKVTQPHLWIQSVLSRNKSDEINYFEKLISKSLSKEKGAFHWSCNLNEHVYQHYDYSQRKNIERKTLHKELTLETPTKEKRNNTSIVEGIKAMLKSKAASFESIYDNISFKKQKYYTHIDTNDDIKFMYLTPNNPDLLLSEIIRYNLKESTFWEETGKRNMVNLLKGLYEIWYRDDFGEMTYLFLSTAFLCSHKVARELAAEIWIKTNSIEAINNNRLGAIIGKLQHSEYAPLKRFTDLLMSNIFNISKSHNKQLFVLLDAVIGNMNDTPIRGLKKLLEIFLELKRSFPELNVSNSTQEKLNIWTEINSLKKIATQLSTT